MDIDKFPGQKYEQLETAGIFFIRHNPFYPEACKIYINSNASNMY
jgi:hypothetical protein